MDKRVYAPQKCILEDLKDVCGIYQMLWLPFRKRT